jgi:hypothetical protein
MITDINFLLASAQSGFVATDFAATNVADLKNIYDVGAGCDVYAVVTVTTAFADGTSIDFQVKAGDNTTVASTDETIGSSGPIPLSALSKGNIFVIRINESRIQSSRDATTGVITPGGRQYVGMWYDITGTFSAGAVNVSIVLDPQTLPKNYNSGFRLAKPGGVDA